MTTGLLFNVLNDASHLQREVDRLLGASKFRGRCAAGDHCDVNLGHDADALYVEMAVPGIAPGDIDLSLEDNVLRVAAKPSETDTGKVTWHRRERGTVGFTHRMRIPVEVDAERISAICKNGILTVTLPKAAAAKPKRIEVKVEQ